MNIPDECSCFLQNPYCPFRVSPPHRLLDDATQVFGVQALEQGQLGSSTILGIVAPLLQQALLGLRGQEGTPHKRKGQADSDKRIGREAAVAESAVAALRSAAAALDWLHYRQLLGRYGNGRLCCSVLCLSSQGAKVMANR